MDRYRHEYKYRIDRIEEEILLMRARGALDKDSHAGKDGTYYVRSLYFDDYEDRCLMENEAGTDPREKFRIRIYDHSSGRISLELKKKLRGKTQKLSCLLTPEQCRSLMAGEIPDMGDDAPAVLQKLCLLMRTRLMRPKVIVEYVRVPYIYSNGNVRITLDTNISSSNRTDLFLEEQIPLRPVLEAGQHVLEVKYDEYLPDFIYHTAHMANLRQTAFSKYYLCRRYHL